MNKFPVMAVLVTARHGHPRSSAVTRTWIGLVAGLRRDLTLVAPAVVGRRSGRPPPSHRAAQGEGVSNCTLSRFARSVNSREEGISNDGFTTASLSPLPPPLECDIFIP